MAKPKSPIPAVRALMAYAEMMEEKYRLTNPGGVHEVIVDLATDLVHLADMNSVGSGTDVINEIKLHYNAEKD